MTARVGTERISKNDFVCVKPAFAIFLKITHLRCDTTYGQSGRE